jgi:RsiW-degrading membrane proteinase PrsW (M82 family)
MKEEICKFVFLILMVISALVPTWVLRKNDFPDPYPIIWLVLFIVGTFFSLVIVGILNAVLI